MHRIAIGHYKRQDKRTLKSLKCPYFSTFYRNYLRYVSRETVTHVTLGKMPTIHRNYSESRQKGNLGEDLACLFLMKRGFRITDRNYLKPWGEIDIIAKKSGILHFVEVKSAASSLNKEDANQKECEIKVSRETGSIPVTYETIRPEENMTEGKSHRLGRVIKTYLSDKKLSHETPSQVDLITIRYDTVSKVAVIERFENVL